MMMNAIGKSVWTRMKDERRGAVLAVDELDVHVELLAVDFVAPSSTKTANCRAPLTASAPTTSVQPKPK